MLDGVIENHAWRKYYYLRECDRRPEPEARALSICFAWNKQPLTVRETDRARLIQRIPFLRTWLQRRVLERVEEIALEEEHKRMRPLCAECGAHVNHRGVIIQERHYCAACVLEILEAMR